MDPVHRDNSPSPPPLPEPAPPPRTEPAPEPVPAPPRGEPATPAIAIWGLVLCFLLLGALLNWGLHHRDERHDLHAHFRALADDYALLRARHDELGRLMASPQIQWLRLQPANNARFGAAVAWHPARHDGALFVTDLALLPEGEQYQLWLEPQDRTPISAAVFNAPRGGAVHFLRPERPINSLRRLFVTVEPAGGSPQPSGRSVASADIS